MALCPSHRQTYAISRRFAGRVFYGDESGKSLGWKLPVKSRELFERFGKNQYCQNISNKLSCSRCFMTPIFRRTQTFWRATHRFVSRTDWYRSLSPKYFPMEIMTWNVRKRLLVFRPNISTLEHLYLTSLISRSIFKTRGIFYHKLAAYSKLGEHFIINTGFIKKIHT